MAPSWTHRPGTRPVSASWTSSTPRCLKHCWPGGRLNQPLHTMWVYLQSLLKWRYSGTLCYVLKSMKLYSIEVHKRVNKTAVLFIHDSGWWRSIFWPADPVCGAAWVNPVHRQYCFLPGHQQEGGPRKFSSCPGTVSSLLDEVVFDLFLTKVTSVVLF